MAGIGASATIFSVGTVVSADVSSVGARAFAEAFITGAEGTFGIFEVVFLVEGSGDGRIAVCSRKASSSFASGKGAATSGNFSKRGIYAGLGCSRIALIKFSAKVSGLIPEFKTDLISFVIPSVSPCSYAVSKLDIIVLSGSPSTDITISRLID